MSHGHYRRLAAMAALSFVSMYVLMYAMVDSPGNVMPNLNQAYMAALMTSPMVIFELLLMGSMYEHRKLNIVIIVVGAIALAAFWFLIRGQAAISDRQFLKSMIPHHGGAVLMCGKAPITDADIRKLCQSIIKSQQSEIDWMKGKLKELGD